MSLQIVQVVVCSIVAFLGGGALAWRLLGRARGGRCPTLAREVTDRVHNRCAAYQLLEERINNVIADFDQREAELRAQWSGGAEVPAEPIVAAAPAAFPLESSTGAEALAWMDSCDTLGQPAAYESPLAAAYETPLAAPFETPFPTPFATFDTPERSATPATDQIVHDEGWAQDTEGVVDQFANRLQILQREKTAELERQRNWVANLEVRILALETAVQSLVQAPPVAVPDTATEENLRVLAERLARTERELVRVRATAVPIAAIPTPQPTVAPDRRIPARKPGIATPSVRSASVPPTERKPSLDDLPGPIDTRRAGQSGNGRTTQGGSSEIGQLMRNLEIAKDETEIYRRKLREQEGHFTAAYSMLERVRPLVDALETELASNIRVGGRS